LYKGVLIEVEFYEVPSELIGKSLALIGETADAALMFWNPKQNNNAVNAMK